jgi:hypothetical protein
LQIPLDPKIKELADMPYTISYIIRKRQQIDNLNELSKKHRPPDDMIWDGSPEELDDFLERVMSGKEQTTVDFKIKPNEIEG